MPGTSGCGAHSLAATGLGELLHGSSGDEEEGHRPEKEASGLTQAILILGAHVTTAVPDPTLSVNVSVTDVISHWWCKCCACAAPACCFFGG